MQFQIKLGKNIEAAYSDVLKTSVTYFLVCHFIWIYLENDCILCYVRNIIQMANLITGPRVVETQQVRSTVSDCWIFEWFLRLYHLKKLKQG
jgi:hypothetical protein